MEGKHNNRNKEYTPLRGGVDTGRGPDGAEQMTVEEIDGLAREFAQMQRAFESQKAELARTQAELAVLQSARGDIYGLLPAAYLALDSDHRIVDINKTAADLLRGSAAMLHKRDFGTFVSPSSYEDFVSHVRGTARRVRTCQLKLRRSDGSPFYAQIDSRAVPASDPTGARTAMMMTDITEHRQALETFSRLAAIVESSDDAIIGKDLDNRITSWNAAAERMYGYRTEEIIGRPIAILWPSETVEGASTILEDLRQGRRIDHHVSVHVAKNGRPIDVSLTVSPIKDADGSITGASTIARDITERRRAAEAIRASEEHLRTILDASPDAIMQIGVDQKVVWANNAAATLVANVVGQYCWEIYGDTPEMHRCAAKKAMEEEQTITTTFCVMDKDGSGREVCWENVGVPLRDACGGIKGALLIARDVTRRQQDERAMMDYQQKLRRQAAELVLAEERERRRLAIALHDNIIQDLAISMLRVEMLKETAQSIDRTLLNDFVRTLSKVIDETRTMTFDISSPTLYRLGLAAAVDELLDDFLRSRHGIEYVFWNDDQDKPLDHDVRVLMFQSVRELLINVVKHAEAEEVAVRIERREETMRLTVADNGKGFDVDHTDLAMHRSGGFGLFSIRERLDYIGGRMEIHSEPGKGSRFVLIAPLKI
ncbi:MAG: PAS domain S-box protein [Phycisphaerae bacterium]|nr:PAS domain S-box protein [Phycisphaerae bacterium]